MNLYLTIITTVLVLTQIIRLTQNAMQLRHLHKIHKHDDYIKKVYEKLEKAADKYLKSEPQNLNEATLSAYKRLGFNTAEEIANAINKDFDLMKEE